MCSQSLLLVTVAAELMDYDEYSIGFEDSIYMDIHVYLSTDR